MQKREGKEKNSFIFRRSGSGTLTSFWQLIFFSFLISSCSMFQKKTQPLIQSEKKALSKSIELLRLEGEGKGELRSGQERMIFSFESILEETKYMIYAIIPGRGEEEIGLSWKKSDPVTYATVHGQLLNDFLRRNYKYEREQKEFVLFFARSLLFLQELKEGKFIESCFKKDKEIHCSKDGVDLSIDQFSPKKVRLVMKSQNDDLPYIIAKSGPHKNKTLTKIVVKHDVNFVFKLSEADLMSLRLLLD